MTRYWPQSFSVPEARLLIVLAPGFGSAVCLLAGGGHAPGTGARRASTAMSLMRPPRVRPPPPPRPGQSPVQNRCSPRLAPRRPPGSVKPCLISGLAEQNRASVPGKARPAGGDLRGTVPPRILHGEEHSSLREAAHGVV